MKAVSFMRLLSSALLIFMILLFLGSEVQASPVGYAREFGLLVHQNNQSEAVFRSTGQRVLESFFAGHLLKASSEDDLEFMTQREFLLNFEKLRLESEGKELKLNDRVLYPMVWLKARRNNWLPNSDLTNESMQEYLYRYSVSQKHGGIPYFEGLVLDPAEISSKNFTSIRQVQEISTDLSARIGALRKLRKPTDAQRELLGSLIGFAEGFDVLQKELRALHHPLNALSNLPEDIRDQIIQNDLNEILDQISYDYSKNTANRVHNLVTGSMQINGRLLQPDEIMNFEDELGKNGWGIYKYGWVIFGGVEAWQFGGGLCGTATIVFTPSWRAGLEIIKRYPHSIYYHNLYPEGSLGLDATIYRGAKNLIMKNTTGSPLLYYVENDTEKKQITLYLIGNSAYRNVEIEGPIQTSRGTYKWIRRMEGFDGKVIEEELVTRYGRMY